MPGPQSRLSRWIDDVLGPPYVRNPQAHSAEEFERRIRQRDEYQRQEESRQHDQERFRSRLIQPFRSIRDAIMSAPPPTTMGTLLPGYPLEQPAPDIRELFTFFPSRPPRSPLGLVGSTLGEVGEAIVTYGPTGIKVLDAPGYVITTPGTIAHDPPQRTEQGGIATDAARKPRQPRQQPDPTPSLPGMPGGAPLIRPPASSRGRRGAVAMLDYARRDPVRRVVETVPEGPTCDTPKGPSCGS